jgi:hypothetical protein
MWTSWSLAIIICNSLSLVRPWDLARVKMLVGEPSLGDRPCLTAADWSCDSRGLQ